MFTKCLNVFRLRIPYASVAGVLALGLLAVGIGCQPDNTEPATEATRSAPGAVAATAAESRLPKLLDLGATRCIPCKMMAPILDDLREEYAGRMEVVFVDVWQNPDAAKPYGIEQIPTQIFFDASGKELGRHTGFISKEDILKKWEELGVELEG